MQLSCVSALALALLILVIVDVPYRCPDGDHSGVTSGDWQMVLSQLLQMLTYGVAAWCLMDNESRLGQGEVGLSPVVEFVSSLIGALIITIQLASLIPAVGERIEVCLAACVGPLMRMSSSDVAADETSESSDKQTSREVDHFGASKEEGQEDFMHNPLADISDSAPKTDDV